MLSQEHMDGYPLRPFLGGNIYIQAEKIGVKEA